MPQSHGKVWLVEKEWDDVSIPDSPILNAVVQGPEGPKRLKKIVIGYNNPTLANEFCENMNRECGNCPRRAALHTTYTVLPNFITVRYRYNEDNTPRS